MSEKKRYIKFYSQSDLSSWYYLGKAQGILDEFDEDAYINSNDINSIIELYNIKKYFDNEMLLNDWTEENIEKYKNIVSSFAGLIGRFLSSINDDNIENTLNNIYFEYKDDFWCLFDKYKLYRVVSKECFEQILSKHSENVISIIKYKNIVNKYDAEIATYLQSSDLTAKIIIQKYLVESKQDYIMPTNFTKKDYDEALNRYIKSDICDIKYLELIFKSSPSSLEINSLTKINAKNKYDKLCMEIFESENSTKSSFSVVIKYGDCFSQTVKDKKYCYVYDKKWFDNYADFPTILNNFKYLFDYWDENWRFNLVSKDNESGLFENLFLNKGDKWYFKNVSFEFKTMKSFSEIKSNYYYLKEKKIDLCDVIEWFFKIYLSQEFNADGFIFNAPSDGTSFLEKNKILLSELDGTLKQFKQFVENGSINRELFELFSEPMIISGIPSFINNKYAYANSDDIKCAINILFLKNNLNNFLCDTSEYDCLCSLLLSQDIYEKELNENQLGFISLLEKMGVIINSNGVIKLHRTAVVLLEELYFSEVLCLSYLNENFDILEKWINNDDLKVESSLFSIPEQKYLNFMLNKNEFTNGPDLRNKYLHSNYPNDPNIQELEFFEILKIIILIIGKINEEFILRERQNCYVKQYYKEEMCINNVKK